LLHVLVFLVFLSSLFHLLVMKLNYNKDAKRVAYFDKAAKAGVGKEKEAASKGRRRKVRVPMVEGSDSGGLLELVVEDGVVYVVSLP
jgi:DnaJ family protein C protein 1